MTDIIAHPIIFESRVARRSCFGWLAALGSWLDRAVIAQNTCRALNELPDQVLRDLGLLRSEIPFAASELASGARLSKFTKAFEDRWPDAKA